MFSVLSHGPAQQLHARYVLQLLRETKKVLQQMPNIIHLSTSYAKEITICGDLHGKLDDLLLIFYKGKAVAKQPIGRDVFRDGGKQSRELRYGFTKEVMKKYRLKSVLKPAKANTETTCEPQQDTSCVDASSHLSEVKKDLSGQHIAGKEAPRSTSASSERRQYSRDTADVKEHHDLLPNRTSSSPLLEVQYLKSTVTAPCASPELTTKEWKQVC
ncbi:hypothetical protein lerEdw1_016711 [Lerista edwardsae]|nr:hypothetical protein lerEdw1_016711 [Lerista edwardsae]